MTPLIRDLSALVPPERLIHDPLRTLAYGTDASFYRLTPKAVVKVESEDEVRAVIAACHAHTAPVTFRAAGTSLSGQAVTDSVLMMLGDCWNGIAVEQNGESIRLQPGVIGADANRRLAAFARKIGPDPASIDSAKIGGIAANNASGMCCGTSDNSYQTLMSMRLVLADGTLVDTGDPASLAAFRQSHAGLLASLSDMARNTCADRVLAERIKTKFAIKNTTGYSLNALVDFDDPVDILQHLLIGSEGTLGFIAEITYRTLPDHPAKASALLLFPTIAEACRAVALLKQSPVAAVELMDRAALRAVEGKPGMPDSIKGLGDSAAALLVETRSTDEPGLNANVAAIAVVLAGLVTLSPIAFTADAAEYGKLWKIRKGPFPAVGAVRKIGTTVIIEDVAFRIEHLAEATLDLQALCAKHGYHEAIIFGHALDGNLHFVFTQDFGIDSEVLRYAAFMDEICRLVVEKYDGSLKAEHGTGRNMAPYVEMEWGTAATKLMWAIKHLLDPAGLLNPGVVLDTDPEAHLRNLKALPPADDLVDLCTECGFCERMCPSHGLTLSPRQRIVGWREIARAGMAGEDCTALRNLYDHHGIDTCAACGLCATACPVGIETGRLIQALRGRRAGNAARFIGKMVADHTDAAMAATRLGLGAAALAGRMLGPRNFATLSDTARKIGLPRMGSALPTAAAWKPAKAAAGEALVYIPSCAARAMGPALSDPERDSLPDVTARVMAKAGFAIRYPASPGGLCCGQPFDSKGLTDLADAKAAEMEHALLEASQGGRLPVVMDTSTCSARLKTFLAGRLELIDIVEFLHDLALPRLDIRRHAAPVMLHIPCSVRKMGLDDKLVAVAKACAERVVIPDGVMCCGFAGDKGFTTPELNDHALRRLRVGDGCAEGFSANRTCEIGLADHAQIPYRSIIYLVDRVSRGK
jgi:D-lactate dehydrogenase